MPDSSRRNAAHGRGAQSNRSGRFERTEVVATDEPIDPERELERSPLTTVTPEATRRILSRNDSPDVPFDASINPYKGCEHGCVYCFARPTHAYLGLSPGLDFETKIFSKPDAAVLLRRELSRASYVPRVIALGANTDPYQPAERDLGITRAILEVLADFEHPLSIVTKSALVVRDLDVLAPMAAKRLAHVYVSITTLDPELARRMEPRASTPAKRLDAIRKVVAAGVPAGVLASPMIPALNDAELERILEAAAAAGATSAGYILLRLPLELKELFAEWLEEHYPLKAKHVLALVRDTRAGELYRSRFGERMSGTGAYAEMLERRFDPRAQAIGAGREARRFRSHAFPAPARRPALVVRGRSRAPLSARVVPSTGRAKRAGRSQSTSRLIKRSVSPLIANRSTSTTRCQRASSASSAARGSPDIHSPITSTTT
jgi:DNA repair photolyase